MTSRIPKQIARRLAVPLAVLPLAFAAPAGAADAPFAGGDDLAVPGAVSALTADFNGDGRLDIFAGSIKASYGAVRLGKQGGGFETAPNIDTDAAPVHAAVADFNGDGNEDLAIAQNGLTKLKIKLGTGYGTFTNATDEVTLPGKAGPIAIGDFNADGKDDFAVQTENLLDGPQVTVRLAVGDGTKFNDTANVPVAAFPIAVGELTSDMKEDIVYGTSGAASAGSLIGTGTGGFSMTPTEPLADVATAPRSVALGDFDSDGKLDLAAAASARGAITVRFGTGDGKFSAGPVVPVAGTPTGIAVGDVDGDGALDLVAANGAGSNVSVRLGDGRGAFSDAGVVAVGKEPFDVALADLNGDGATDLVTASPTGDTLSVRYGASPAPLAGNLLVNGGFEGATASGVYTKEPAIPGWERRGGMTYIRYGLPSHAFLPSRLGAPLYAGGTGLLWGGKSSATNGITEAFQTVDVSSAAGSIDAGKATANLSAYLGGTMLYGDRMGARAEFLAGAGDTLSSVAIGPVTAQDRNNRTTLLRRAASAPVPAGTRRIRVTLTSTDDDKAYSSAVADNVKLTLDAPPLPEPEVPSAFGARTRVTLRLASRRIRPSAPVRVRIANANGFQVRGSVRLGRRASRVTLAPNGRKVVKLRLPAKLRRELARKHRVSLRLWAVVRDPAGNARTVRKRAAVAARTR